MKFNMWIKFFIAILSLFVCAGNGENSFTPLEVVFPIRSIQLSTEISGTDPAGDVVTLYECSTDDCMVTLFSDTDGDSISDADDLDDFSIDFQITDESYRYLTVRSCTDSMVTYTATLKGLPLVTYDARTYDKKALYTHADYGLAEYINQAPQSVSVEFSDCYMYYELQSDFEVSDSEVSPLTLFMDFTDIAWVKYGVQSEANGCGQYEDEEEDTVSICMGYPHMVPVQSETSPIVENYNIYNNDSSPDTAGGRIVFFVDDEEEFLGGFSRFIFSEDSEAPGYPYFFNSIQRVTQNDSGSYSFSTYGQYSDTTYLNFADFARSDHDSSTGTNRVYTDDNGNDYDYAADRLD